MAAKDVVELEVAGHTVRITSPDKVFFAERGDTKLDLVHYYLAVDEPLMRTMGGRPVLLQRFPDGAERQVVLPEAGARQRARLAATTDGRQHAQRHHVAAPS